MKQQETNEVKPFDTKTEINVLKALNKLLEENKEESSRVKPEDVTGVMDVSNCIIVVAKAPDAKRLLSRYSDLAYSHQKVPELDYTKSNLTTRGKYSVTFVTYALKLMDATAESASISTQKDYPITIENQYFKVIIAPRVEND